MRRRFALPRRLGQQVQGAPLALAELAQVRQAIYLGGDGTRLPAPMAEIARMWGIRDLI